MAYKIPLTEAGMAMYEQRDQDLERAVVFFVERIGVDEWAQRKQAVHDRFFAKLNAKSTPDVGVSVRDREDEFAWYLYQAETLIADPVAVNADQANRIAPFLSAVGRKLYQVLQIENIDVTIDALTRPIKNLDPDQAIFELLVGSAYVEEGWRVESIPTDPRTKTPDFRIKRGTRQFELECKRLSRRSEYTDKERDAWLRLWRPAHDWIVTNRESAILTVAFHAELNTLASDFLLNLVRDSRATLFRGQTLTIPGTVTIHARAVDYENINRQLRDHYVKVGSPRERQIISGDYLRDAGLTSSIGGRRVHMGPITIGGNDYWDSIEYVVAAYWYCDAPDSIDAKARDIMKRLSDATAQFTGRLPGIVHLGIESESNPVERVRAEKIKSSIDRFDPRGQPLEWVLVNNFRGESLPDGSWALDETMTWKGSEPELFRPLRSGFVAIPSDTAGREGHHFDR